MIANMIRQSFKGAEHIGLQLWGLFMQSAAMIYFIYFFFPAKQLNIQLVKIRTQSFQCCPVCPTFQASHHSLGKGRVMSVVGCLFRRENCKCSVVYQCLLVSSTNGLLK